MVLKVVIELMVIFLLFALMNLIYATSTYIQTRKRATIVNADATSIENGANFLSYIDAMIQIEVQSVIQTLASVNTPYNMMKIDNDIEVIGKNVFDGLSKSMLTMDSCFTTEYIMRYISIQTSTRLFMEAQELNGKLHLQKLQQ